MKRARQTVDETDEPGARYRQEVVREDVHAAASNRLKRCESRPLAFNHGGLREPGRELDDGVRIQPEQAFRGERGMEHPPWRDRVATAGVQQEVVVDAARPGHR